MPTQDTSNTREKIMSILKTRGPSLPVHIARETGLSMLFASAFLSELLSEKKIKISNMRVGNSPIYFIPGQEPKIEDFSQHLKSREKDAFVLLKEKKFLKDEEQEPAIRIALRAIKDFAIPFRKNEEIFWRYFIIPETEFQKKETSKQEPIKKSKEESTIKETIKEPEKEKPIIEKHTQKTEEKPMIKETIQESPEKKEELGIFNKSTEKKKPIKKKPIKKKQNDKFFNRVKEFLLEKSIEILDIESFNKNDLVLRIRANQKEQLLIAYNKKRISENDIIKAHKKASETNLKYIVLSLGEPLKKISNLIEALRDLKKLEILKD
jgi:hypothetical protein